MKIKSLKTTDYQPIKNLELDNLGNIVIIAGANGTGKTRLKQAIIQTLGEASSPVMDLTLVATRPEKKISISRAKFLKLGVVKITHFYTITSKVVNMAVVSMLVL